jgi:hypothetical protein
MARWLWAAVVAIAAVLLISVAAASSLTISGLANPIAGVNEEGGCDVGEVYPHPTFSADGADHWTYWRMETSAYDASDCPGQEIRFKVAWDSADLGDEPDGYYYMRVPVTEDLNKPTIVGRTIAGVFRDAQADICDPDNCYEVDDEGHDIIRYIYASPSYDPATIIDATPDVAGHQLGETEWIVTSQSAPLEDF